MKLNKLALMALALSLTFTSCSNDDDTPPVTPLGDYESGIIILNEGQFFGGNASVSFVSNDLSVVENDVFNNVNGELLGDTAQSITFNDNRAYVVVNVSKKIEVVNRNTFSTIATIDTGLTNPRYMAIANGKGYVTDWGDGSDPTDDFIAVIDLETNTITSTIPVGEGPEQIIANNTTVYVSHKGGFNSNNIVSAINAATNTVQTITVNDNPDEMVFDISGNLLVLCEGRQIFNADFSAIIDHTIGSITKINTSDNTIDSSTDFEFGSHPRLFTLDDSNGDIYYYLSGSVFKLGAGESVLPMNSIITETLYGGGSLVVRNNQLFTTKTDFTADTGELKIYDLLSNTLIDTKELKEGASKVYFN